jgi:NAD(P)-dependent dehydrogenase (short-subunit alcohol dehydrogenase family)
MGQARQFAVVAGASSGIGYVLARICAEHKFDVLVAADGEAAAQEGKARGSAPGPRWGQVPRPHS